jgi:hypothetical protein
MRARRNLNLGLSSNSLLFGTTDDSRCRWFNEDVDREDERNLGTERGPRKRDGDLEDIVEPASISDWEADIVRRRIGRSSRDEN